MNELLLIFVRNPELGKVKTRLAKTMGDQAALDIYKKLLEYTCAVSVNINVKKQVYYADAVAENDIWTEAGFEKKMQINGDLGAKMKAAFLESFSEKHHKIVLIGSDCFELTTEILEQAFAALNDNDVVLGPALDGGYYLIGMKKLHAEFFTDKPWSTAAVAALTLTDAEKMNLKVHLLPELSDIDEESDLIRSGFVLDVNKIK